MTRAEKNDTRPGMSRREALKLAALGGSSLMMMRSLSACADGDLVAPTNGRTSPLGTADDGRFVGGLTTSLLAERRYEPRVTGRLPRALRGALYKNGPGVFERGGVRRRTLLDGDGLITAYRFADGKVEFQNRFVRTPKFVAEQPADKFLYNSWTTPLEHPLSDASSTQAGVTVWPWGNRLYAFDENNLGWELSPDDLQTVGQTSFGLERTDALLFAHGKQLAGSREFTLFGAAYQSLQYNQLVIDEAHRVTHRRGLRITDYGPPAYMHDWFVTPHYFVLHVMPALIDGEAMASGSVLRDALRWTPSMPSRFLVFRRGDEGGPRIFELDATWMWHSVNAFERGNELVLDWIGYDDPYHFVGVGSEWERIMEGQIAPSGAPGILRRTVLNLQTGAQSTTRFTDLRDQEFPYIAPSKSGLPYRYTYFVHEPGAGVLYQAVAKLDIERGRADVFDFGPQRIALEPVFAPRPSSCSEDDGFLLVEVANADTGRASLCILDARRVADGPIAEVQLDHHVPMRFHGRWSPG